MKKVLLSAFVLLTIGAISFVSCQKNPINKNHRSLVLNDSNFVTKKVALNLARHINPQIFLHHSKGGSASKPTGSNNNYSIGGDSNQVHLLSSVTNYFAINDDNGKPALYVINYAADSGYIVISADYRFEPICAYSDQGNLEPTDTIPAMLGSWFGHTVEDIEMVRNNEVDNDTNAAEEWEYWANIADIYVTQDHNFPPLPNPCLPVIPPTVVGPLLTTIWGQDCGFNNLLPDIPCYYSQCPNDHRALAGCVGVAMAQIIKYWQYPSGYNYSSMPDVYGYYPTQKLIHDVDSFVGMNYGCAASSASVDDISGTFTNSFNYATATLTNHLNNNDRWTIIGDLNSGRPVILSGFTDEISGFLHIFHSPAGVGHAWDCDGYKEHGNACIQWVWFHMNWGWHDPKWLTWCYWDNWSVSAPNIQYNFQYFQKYVHDIQP